MSITPQFKKKSDGFIPTKTCPSPGSASGAPACPGKSTCHLPTALRWLRELMRLVQSHVQASQRIIKAFEKQEQKRKREGKKGEGAGCEVK